MPALTKPWALSLAPHKPAVVFTFIVLSSGWGKQEVRISTSSSATQGV